MSDCHEFATGGVPIPFQRGYGSEIPMWVHFWMWSCTYGRWSAYVQFYDGEKCLTYPA